MRAWGAVATSIDRRGDAAYYRRHWTPVHLDSVIDDDLPAAVARAQTAGAVVEAPITTYAWGSMAVLADPFGHGLCLLQLSAQGCDAMVSRP